MLEQVNLMRARHRFWQIIALIVLIAGLAGIIRLYRGEVHWKNEPPLEGIIALYAGVIAFVAVMIQLEEERNARFAEQDRQRRAIAKAILCEIDNFCKMELKQVERNLNSQPSGSEYLASAVGLRSNISEIYKAVSPILGSLSAKSVSAIVEFYSMVGLYEGQWRNYQYSLDMIWRSDLTQEIVNAFDACARRELNSIRTLIPELKELATEVSNAVAQDCGLSELAGRTNAKTN